MRLAEKMKYKSTRDQNILFTFEDALCSGYAPDGGLFVPESIPKVEPVTWKEWAKLDYIDLATTVLRLFVGKEVPEDDLRLLCQKAFAGFGKQEIVPVVPLSDKIYVIELFHGPTFCFKDLAMRVVVNLLGYFAEKRKKQFTLIVSTTGDTGPAAVQAIQDSESPNLGILVHYPEGQISDFQRKQLTTATSSKIRVVAFQGGGDDMDGPIKNIMTDNSSVSKERFICGINSYNIGRPLVQMVHFVSERLSESSCCRSIGSVFSNAQQCRVDLGLFENSSRFKCRSRRSR